VTLANNDLRCLSEVLTMFFLSSVKKKETENKYEGIQVQGNIDWCDDQVWSLDWKRRRWIQVRGKALDDKLFPSTVNSIDIPICISLEVRLYRFVFL